MKSDETRWMAGAIELIALLGAILFSLVRAAG